MRIDEPDPAGVGDLPSREVRTDKNRRFKLEGFVPGMRYKLSAMTTAAILGRLTDGTQFKSGEEKDLGDVMVQPQ